jgi:NlpC/P60 family putative phage cell wall peptidase
MATPVGTCTVAQLLAEARSWQGTPYHNRAALKGVGADCIGFVIGVAKNVGILDSGYDPGVYSEDWHLHHNEERLAGEIEAFGCVLLSLEERQPGDLLLFQFGRVCAHSGLLLDDGCVIHAVRDFERVLVTSLRGEWLERLRRAYRFPGVM